MEVNINNLREEDFNFVELTDVEEHKNYFRIIFKLFSLLYRVYQAKNFENTYECDVIVNFLKKLSVSMQALHLKYISPAEGNRNIWLDLSESGFPNQVELEGLQTDINTAQERLINLPSQAMLCRNLLDEMMANLKAPKKLLTALAERSYLDFILKSDPLLPYNAGLIKFINQDNYNLFSYSFACYDYATNRPFFNIMTLESEEKNADEFIIPHLGEFEEIVKKEGKRATPLGVLAVSLDQALDTIHPKIIKRVGLGPLYTRCMLESHKPNRSDKCEMAIRALFDTLPQDEDDFILFISEETVFSKSQKKTQSLFSLYEKTREIYAIDLTDEEAFKKKASAVNYSILLPHHLMQNINKKEAREIEHFAKARKFIYNEKGEVYGI